MKKLLGELCTATVIYFCAAENLFAIDNQINTNHTVDKNLNLIKKWDRVFSQSSKVSHSKVTSRSRYGTMLAADMYEPKCADGKLPVIAISGPFGAVRKQSSGLYARKSAERGFLTIVFGPSCTGESGGEPCYVAFPDINTEDFCAAVDFLSTRDNVDAEHIGVLGICGWGGMALNAAAIDTRTKATVTPMVCDMNRANADGYFDVIDAGAHYELRKRLNEQCTADTENGLYAPAGGLPDTLPDDASQLLKDYYVRYRAKRGYHKRSLNPNDRWNKTSVLSFINMSILSYSDEIRSAILTIHREKVYSRYFSEDAFKKLKGDSKELLIIPGANHVDLHDQMSVILFDRIERFLVENLK